MTRRALFTVTVLVAMAVAAFAQRNKDKKEDANQRTIEGVVSDQSRNLIPKAIEGNYHFSGLRMDTDYELKASLNDQSSQTKRVSSFETRKTVTVNLQLEKK
jgi:hypothetical protein